MRRHVFTALSAFSALAFIATCIMWFRSHLIREAIEGDLTDERTFVTGDFCILSEEGELRVQRSTLSRPLRFDYVHPMRYWEYTHFDRWLTGKLDGSWGFSKETRADSGIWVSLSGSREASSGSGHILDGRYVVFSLPYWFIVLSFAAMPSIWTYRRLRPRPTRRRGYCSKCGYDLRATPDRCPECGAVPEAIRA
jgi:hypothetical protein